MAEVAFVGEADADEGEGQVVFLRRGMRVTWPQPRQVMATWGSLRWRMRVRLLAPGTRKELQLRQTLLRRSLGRWVRFRVPILRARSMYRWARWGSVGYVDSACLKRVRMRSSGILVLGGICVGLFSGFVWWGEVYKSMEGYGLLERGGAARLARGAHNPEVGSSNLPPATISVVKVAAYSGFSGVHCSV